jgi:hypothetical protein
MGTNNVPKRREKLLLLYKQFGDSPFIYKDITAINDNHINNRIISMWCMSKHIIKIGKVKLKYQLPSKNTNKVMYINRTTTKYKLSDTAIKYCEKNYSNF